jgi:hypothetical protein
MSRALKAGLAYFSIVFAVGFGLGTLRVLVMVPLFGEVSAVAIELPIMLALSWVACRWLINRFAVPAVSRDRLLMGGSAFLLLMAAELGVSVLAFGRSPAEHWATYRMLSAKMGLLAQIGFALMPLLAEPRPQTTRS